VCEPKTSVASITVLEGSGLVQVDNFATALRASKDYLHASLAVHDRANGTIQRQRLQDARRMSPGLEYATQMAKSPKGRHVYVAEYISDSVSVFAIDNMEPEGRMDFIDRR
jgi:hypothetical protein